MDTCVKNYVLLCVDGKWTLQSTSKRVENSLGKVDLSESNPQRDVEKGPKRRFMLDEL